MSDTTPASAPRPRHVSSGPTTSQMPIPRKAALIAALRSGLSVTRTKVLSSGIASLLAAARLPCGS